MTDWLAFWNSPNRIYVNDHHRDVHYRDVALQMRSFVLSPDAVVLDYGCGEATRADLVAEAAGHLFLSDGASVVREKIAARFKDHPKITVLSPAEIEKLGPGRLDLIVINSVAQYMGRREFEDLLVLFLHLLSRNGKLVVGDVIPPHTSALTEVTALMKLAWRNGFVLPALLGLARTVFSDYRALRAELGLTYYTEAEMLDTLKRAGFSARRRYPNIEHNQARMTFVAEPRGVSRAAA
jgi:cyclopropane fatty-acyl-phospholipid synthase-like methyltransferase